jgi:glucuronoarabinoxylan endo-1,4-beta-xylanase
MLEKKYIISGLCFFLVLNFSVLNAQVATIDLTNLKQSISGFGGAHYPEWGTGLTTDQVDKAFGNNPGQIGLQILRLPVSTDTIDFSKQVPAAARAKSDGAILFATPWSPPPSMKTNKNVNQGKLDTAHYKDFANYLDSFAIYMASNDAPLFAISIQNEPDWLPTYASCGWYAKDFISFLSKYGSNISATKIMAPESLNFKHSMTDSILNDSAAASHVDIIAGHIYGSGIADYPLAREKGKEVWMSEHYVDGTNWTSDMATAKEINDCMIANFNAYVYWTIRTQTGFLSDAGDILKRGYVMSQFAKFIRPGYTRVDAVTSSAPNIDITAYKNDTNVVIVIINRNSTSDILNITIQNGSVHSFTKFTTSESKNVTNEGKVITSGGSFTAALDARSITTFTTFPENGGRSENSAPVADAGIDQTLTDTDNNGRESITLDGSASSDPDGTVAIFTWSEAGKEIASGINPTFEIGTGIHHILLTITDNDGATAKDSLVVTVNLPSGSSEVHLWFEAECGNVGSSWNIVSNASASNGKYVTIKSGMNSKDAASEASADQVSFTLNITENGTYTIWSRNKAPTADDDSYWVKMDDGAWVMWNNISGGANFVWDYVLNSDNNSYNLTAGSHTLTFAYREDGTQLDKIYITNTGTVPTGLGGTDSTCVIDNIKLTGDFGNNFNIYPNPLKNSAVIEFYLAQPEYVNLSIANLTGSTVFTLYDGIGKTGKNILTFNVNNLKQGVFLCRLSTTGFSYTKQLMIIR